MKFKLTKPRRITTVRCLCFASPELFRDWNQLSTAAKKEFETNGPIPCEGGGCPGEWCNDCRFGIVELPEEE